MKGPRNPTAAQHGAKRRREQRDKEDKPTKQSKRNDQTKTHEKDKDRATEAKKETGTHRTGSEMNTQAQTPQREETSHVQNRLKHACTQQRAAKETERTERRGKGTN